MKKQYYIFILLFACFSKISTAQILCIYCYDQDAPVSIGVNNLLLNGGFENSNCGLGFQNSFCPNSSYYSCNVTNWTCTGGGSNTSACLLDSSFLITTITEGDRAVYFANYFCNACSPTVEDTSCINSNGCTVTGIPNGYPVNDTSYGGTLGVSLGQNVTGLLVGNIYVLEFWAGGENDNFNTFPKPGLFAVDVGFGDTLFRDKPTAPFSGTGTRFIIEFIATSSSHTIKFTNWGHICSYCTDLVLDDVRLYTQAELSVSVPHCTLGKDDMWASQSELIISPNPVTNELNVKTNSNSLSEIILYDFVSRKILQQKFTNSISLNTEQLSKGLYLYEVRSKDGSYKKGKVVKD